MPAKKKATKKKQTAPKTVKIQFKCAPTCQARPKHPKLHRNDSVILAAIGTNVTLTFNKSPFQSGNKNFSITAGNSVTEVIKSNAAFEEYFYQKVCSACSNPQGDPSVIVEP